MAFFNFWLEPAGRNLSSKPRKNASKSVRLLSLKVICWKVSLWYAQTFTCMYIVHVRRDRGRGPTIQTFCGFVEQYLCSLFGLSLLNLVIYLNLRPSFQQCWLMSLSCSLSKDEKVQTWAGLFYKTDTVSCKQYRHCRSLYMYQIPLSCTKSSHPMISAKYNAQPYQEPCYAWNPFCVADFSYNKWCHKGILVEHHHHHHCLLQLSHSHCHLHCHFQDVNIL